MFWVTIILGMLMAFLLLGFWLTIRWRQFLVQNMPVTVEEEVEEESTEQYSLAEQMMMANDKDTAVQELVLAQRLRLMRLDLNQELVDNMTFYLYQRLWS